MKFNGRCVARVLNVIDLIDGAVEYAAAGDWEEALKFLKEAKSELEKASFIVAPKPNEIPWR